MSVNGHGQSDALMHDAFHFSKVSTCHTVTWRTIWDRFKQLRSVLKTNEVGGRNYANNLGP